MIHIHIPLSYFLSSILPPFFLSDIIRLATNSAKPAFPLSIEDIEINNDYEAKFYVRISCKDGLGIVRAAGEAAEQAGVSINAILQVCSSLL